MDSKKHELKDLIMLILALLLVFTIFDALGIGCPIRFVTGVSCMGCGMSRAWIALLHLDLKSAYCYHPLFWVPALFVPAYLLRERIPEKIKRYLLYAVIILFTVVYIIRMADPDDTIVYCDFQRSFIHRIVAG
ncbi:MAG: DUF2752 domain-containing protein [Lachnospiraceae bacterium]|nr:DUF2752 domain-containing protein [Lachnospiraceae bacterium]